MNKPTIWHNTVESGLTVELTSVCNLHCRYCLRDEDSLYQKAQFLSPELLQRITAEARDVMNLRYVSFTGGEPTLHPRFADILAGLAAVGLECSFVTNGWHFERIHQAVLAHRATVRLISFSLDGATAEAHDHWRGAGSFARVMSAITRCFMGGIPFAIKTVIRRDTLPQLEQIALLAARLGAANVQFSHLLPTSAQMQAEMQLSLSERTEAEREISLLDRVFRIPVGITVGWYDTDPAPPCPSLLGRNANVDYRGQLTLCCNLSGFRGAAAQPDAVADLTQESFISAYKRLQLVVSAQNQRRQQMLAQLAAQNQSPDLSQGSPCLFCLDSFALIPWQGEMEAPRSLPVLSSAMAATSAAHPYGPGA